MTPFFLGWLAQTPLLSGAIYGGFTLLQKTFIDIGEWHDEHYPIEKHFYPKSATRAHRDAERYARG